MYSKGKRALTNKNYFLTSKAVRLFSNLFLFSILLFIFNGSVHAALPLPWIGKDIGAESNGSADFLNNLYTVRGSGSDIGGLNDTFYYMYQSYTGDTEIIAKVESQENTDPQAKAGVMIRETFSASSKNVFMAIAKSSASVFQRRTISLGSTTVTSGTLVSAPYWIKLVRRGNNFTGYQSPDGNIWTQIGSMVSISMASNVYVGLAVTSHRSTYYNASVFSNVSVLPATPPPSPVLSMATGGQFKADLTWAPSARAKGYKIKYGTIAGSYPNVLTLGNVTSAEVPNLNGGTTYYFVVTATNDYGESGNSNQMNAAVIDPPAVFIKKIDYNAMGQKTRIEYGNGVITTNTYDSLNLRLKRIYTVNASAQVLQDLSYTYDSAGNILSITDAVNTATQNFKYDELNRLTQASGTSYGTKNYQYDPVGNIVQKDGKIYSYAEGGAGVHAVTSLSDGTTMTYDANGNMASKQKGSELVLFLYDAENRLIEVKKNGVTTAKYEYDGDGGRVKKTVGSTVTRYVGSLYEETNGVKTRHIFVGDMKVTSITGAQQMYYHVDHLGGTNVLTDKIGTKKEVTEYEPFGGFSRRDKYGTGQEVANFYFTGQRFDEESGLYYYGARYYDPSLGRFITADTVVQAPGSNPQTFNRYSYCGNNPVNRIDPSGHSFWKTIWKAIKDVVKVFFNFQVPGLGDGLTGGSFATFNQQAINIGASFIFSFGNPFAVISSFYTYNLLNTETGERAQKWIAKEVFDDVLGFSSNAATFLSSTVTNAIVGSLFYVNITPGVDNGIDFRDTQNKESIRKYGDRKPKPFEGGRSANYIANNPNQNPSSTSDFIRVGRISSNLTSDDVLTKLLNLRHVAVVVKDQTGQIIDSAIDFQLPLKGKLFLLPGTGTCQQSSFSTLIKGGASGREAFGAVLDQAGASFYVTTAIYGADPSFSAVGLINAGANNDDR